MNLIEKLKKSFDNFLIQKFALNKETINKYEFEINIDESKKDFGDINSNIALILAKELKKNPNEIAKTIAIEFSDKFITKIEAVNPGFLNFFLSNYAYIELVKDLYQSKQNFFKLNPNTKKYNYSVEFVSANPTGPLHIGHGRGGIIGDVLGNILKFIGHNVTKEFYINDAGNQIKKLGLSFKIRCQQIMGQNVQLPEDAYHGTYLIDLANKCIKEFGNDALNKSDEFFENYAKEKLLKEIEKTLIEYGITFDVWFSEKSLINTGEVEKSIQQLINNGFTYEKDDALWFKSTEFGDDKDRVIRKMNGELTYVASDVAYMQNKIERGANFLIMVLGQDHHSYVVRLNGIKQALGLIQYPLDVILYQLVKIKEDGEFVKLSKRAGKIVSLKEIIETVGADVARFFYLNRKADAQLELDLDLALKKTEENPVYYIQYAYVRLNSILEKANEEKILEITLNDANNISIEEYYLIKKILSLKFLLESISKNYQTHLLAYYLIELATIFHRYYYNNRIIDQKNIDKTKARLLMVLILKNTFETTLDILGISKPEKM